LAGCNPWSWAAQSPDCALKAEEFFMPERSVLLLFKQSFIFEVDKLLEN
jgi:hypothetical protein